MLCVFSKPKNKYQTKKKSSAWIFYVRHCDDHTINCRWYQNTELAINRPTCLLLKTKSIPYYVCVRVPFEIYITFQTQMGARRPTQTTVLCYRFTRTYNKKTKKKIYFIKFKNRFAFEIHNIFLLFAYFLFLLLRHEK